MRSLVGLALALTLLSASPGLAEADREYVRPESTSDARAAYDLVVLRPLQALQVLVSAIAFVPAYPVAWPFGGGEDVLELCITEPIERISRPLGEL